MVAAAASLGPVSGKGGSRGTDSWEVLAKAAAAGFAVGVVVGWQLNKAVRRWTAAALRRVEKGA